MSGFAILALFIVGIGIVLVAKGVRVVRQSECMIIEKFGRYNRTLREGLQIIIPFMEQPRSIYWLKNSRMYATNRIDVRETVMDIPEQDVITRDNVAIIIDAILYAQITDPYKATYEIASLPLAVIQLAQTSLRNLIGEMALDATLTSRDSINTKLKVILDEATDKWGIKVNRVELKNITPPRDVQQAMEKEMQAERERRAKVLQAKGDRQSRIERSEGERQEQINLSEGDKEAFLRRAEGEASAIREVAAAKRQAISEIKAELGSEDLALKYLVATNYLDVFGKFSQKPGDKVFIPYEASDSLGALGSIKEIMAGKSS